MGDGIRVGVLGSLEVWRRNRPVRLASALQRMLVARLALDPGRTVAVEALVDDLWEDRPPADARGALHHHVSRLRKAIGPVVVTRGAGYLLEVDPDDVDALRFARLARTGGRPCAQVTSA
jgi:DNA-binding SARP family transcriptional activator